MDHRQALEIIRDSSSVPELIARLRVGEAPRLMFNWAVKYFLDARAREKGFPLKGMFELTPFCNLDCKMCYVHLNASQLRGRSLLTVDQWKSVMDSAIDAGMMYASLTGGECLTYPGFDEIYLHLQRRGVQVGILTNGILLNEDRIRFFVENAPSSIQITLYGADEDMYERVCGRREFSAVVENIKAADRAGLPVLLSTTPNPFMLPGDDERLVRFAASFGLQFHVNSSLIDPRDETDRSGSFADHSPEDYVRLFLLERELKGHLPPTECVSDLPKPGGTTSGSAPRGLKCGGGRSAFNVSWEGKMSPCNRLRHISGDLLSESFDSVWKKVNAAAEDYLLPAECQSCAYGKVAKVCAAEHMGAPEGHADKNQCRWCRAMVSSGLSSL